MSKRFNRSLILLMAFALFVSGAVAVFADKIYPLKTDVTVTWWAPLHANVALVAKNLGDTAFAKELQKRTGVKIKFLHPASGQEREAFNLMLASGDLPDIIEYNWYSIPGGPYSALANGYIMKLNPVFQKYAPNLSSFLKKNKDYDKMIKCDDGSYYVFPFFRADLSLLVTSGPIIREDWLNDLGLKSPTTIDEWYTDLKAFKDKKGATAPLCVEYSNLSNMFAGGFNNTGGFYVEKDKVKFGGIEANRKEFFATMNKWYNEGLLDKNFATISRKIIDANILGGKSGATYGSGGSGIGRYMDANAKDTKYSLIGAAFPGPKKGQVAKFANMSQVYGNSQGSAAISAKCKNVEAAARLLDYAYGKEGNMLYNFGIEGVSYTMEGNNPKYTELIMKNPQGMTNTQVMSLYMRGHTNGPFIQDKRYIEQYYERPQQKAATANWKKNDWEKYIMPPVTPTADESSELAKIMGDITTYSDEMSLKFIMGVEPLSNYDKYVAQIKSMGIEKAIAIYQAAYNRYDSRK